MWIVISAPPTPPPPRLPLAASAAACSRLSKYICSLRVGYVYLPKSKSDRDLLEENPGQMELDEVTKFVHKFFPEHQKDQFKEELKKVKSSKKDDIHMRYDSDCWEYKNNLGKTSWFSNQKPQQPHLIFYVNYFINLKQLTKLISLGTMNILLKVKFFTNEKNANDIEKQIVDNIFVKDPEAEEKFYQEKRSQEAIGKVHYDRTFENKKMDEKNAFWNTILTNNYFPVLINPITQLLFSQKMIDKMTHLYINRIVSIDDYTNRINNERRLTERCLQSSTNFKQVIGDYDANPSDCPTHGIKDYCIKTPGQCGLQILSKLPILMDVVTFVVGFAGYTNPYILGYIYLLKTSIWIIGFVNTFVSEYRETNMTLKRGVHHMLCLSSLVLSHSLTRSFHQLIDHTAPVPLLAPELVGPKKIYENIMGYIPKVPVLEDLTFTAELLSTVTGKSGPDKRNQIDTNDYEIKKQWDDRLTEIKASTPEMFNTPSFNLDHFRFNKDLRNNIMMLQNKLILDLLASIRTINTRQIVLSDNKLTDNQVSNMVSDWRNRATRNVTQEQKERSQIERENLKFAQEYSKMRQGTRRGGSLPGLSKTLSSKTQDIIINKLDILQNLVISLLDTIEIDIKKNPSIDLLNYISKEFNYNTSYVLQCGFKKDLKHLKFTILNGTNIWSAQYSNKIVNMFKKGGRRTKTKITYRQKGQSNIRRNKRSKHQKKKNNRKRTKRRN